MVCHAGSYIYRKLIILRLSVSAHYLKGIVRFYSHPHEISLHPERHEYVKSKCDTSTSFRCTISLLDFLRLLFFFFFFFFIVDIQPNPNRNYNHSNETNSPLPSNHPRWLVGLHNGNASSHRAQAVW
jgi:hypothetical protein